MSTIDVPLPLDGEPPPGAGSALAAALAATLDKIAAAARHPDPAKMVHHARRSMKDYRALLRLIPGPAARAARQETAAIARALASARDHAAAQEALETLRDRSGISLGDFKAARALIGADAPADSHLAECRDILPGFLDTARKRLADGLAAAATAADLPAGLTRTYRRARAGRFKTAEAMHDLRKDVVIHRYQMSFIAAWFGGRGRRRAERTQALRDLLGLHHDMEILDPMLAALMDGLGPPATKRVRRAARRQQKDLRRQARRLHRKLFRRKPKAFARLWRDLAAGTSSDAPAAPEGDANPPTGGAPVGAAAAEAKTAAGAAPALSAEPTPPPGAGGHGAPAGTRAGEAAGPASSAATASTTVRPAAPAPATPAATASPADPTRGEEVAPTPGPTPPVAAAPAAEPMTTPPADAASDPTPVATAPGSGTDPLVDPGTAPQVAALAPTDTVAGGPDAATDRATPSPAGPVPASQAAASPRSANAGSGAASQQSVNAGGRAGAPVAPGQAGAAMTSTVHASPGRAPFAAAAARALPTAVLRRLPMAAPPRAAPTAGSPWAQPPAAPPAIPSMQADTAISSPHRSGTEADARGAAAQADPAAQNVPLVELPSMSESQPGLPATTVPGAAGSTLPRTLPAAPGPARGGSVPNRLFARFIAGISALNDPDYDAGHGPEAFRAVDRAASALTARFTGGLSPVSMTLATLDWAMHLAGSPGKQAELWLKATRKMSRFTSYMLASTLDPSLPACIAPLKDDDRFRAPQWQQLPYRLWYQGFLLTQQFWHNATTGVPGVSATNERRVAFGARQALDMFSPANFPFTNPEVVERTRKTGGLNFLQGARNAAENLARKAMHQPPVGAEAFIPGETVAVTAGEVIYRNHLIELIQYRATTPDVEAEPILIVPAWIMKYYILDLSPENSLIRYLVDKGHTVFCISWRNVSAADRDIGLNDYLRLGLMAALDAVGKVCPGHKVHAAGYCLGGTLLSIGAAAMAQAGDPRLASVTLFAAQTDFSEPGELELFVDESELYFLESMMWDKGFLTAGQMAGAFQMLRSNDLVWSRMVREYMMGERTPLNDLMAWNADATRMPFRMHSQYLRRLFLKNDLAAGRYEVDGRPVSLLNLRLPLFVVGTERDHVAPWRSVYKIHQLTDTDVTFVLASGGHNAGIVSEPGHRNRSYRLHETRVGELHLGPEEWVETTPPQDGSWWPAWEAWLTGHSAPGRFSLPPLGIPGEPGLGPAPGTYVMQR